MSFFLKPNFNLFKQQKETQPPRSPVLPPKQVSPDAINQNWCDESSYLDNSTVPTYEEFTKTNNTKPKIKKKKSILKNKFSFLNSTDASCLLTGKLKNISYSRFYITYLSSYSHFYNYKLFWANETSTCPYFHL